MAKSHFKKSRLNELIQAALGIYAVYLIIVIARAGYETGQVLAGKATIAEAFARSDASNAGLVVCGFFVFLALSQQKSR